LRPRARLSDLEGFTGESRSNSVELNADGGSRTGRSVQEGLAYRLRRGTFVNNDGPPALTALRIAYRGADWVSRERCKDGLRVSSVQRSGKRRRGHEQRSYSRASPWPTENETSCV
jgi:hypothetical protein